MSNSQTTNDDPPWDTDEEVFQDPAWWVIVDYPSDTRVKVYGTLHYENGFYAIYNDNGDPVSFIPASPGVHALRSDVFDENYNPEEDGDDNQDVG